MIAVKVGQTLTRAELEAVAAFGDVTLTVPDLSPALTGADSHSGLRIGRRITGRPDLLPQLTWWRNGDGTITVSFALDQPDLDDTITVSLEITNSYELSGSVTSYVIAARVPTPLADHDTIEEWAGEYLTPFTGTGRTRGDSWYETTVVDSSMPELVGRTF